MKVIDWISDDDCALGLESVGWMGGWFSDGHTWQDYIDEYRDDAQPYLTAIKDDVLASGRFIDGRMHGEDDEGVPLFEDETIGRFSARGWGDLMAAIATEKDGKDHNYMEFYWS